MVQVLGIVGKMWSMFHKQSSPVGAMSLLLIAAIVGGSCSNGNDESPSQADDIAAITALLANIVPLADSDGADGLFTLYSDDVVLMVPDSWTDLDRDDALAFYTDVLGWAKPDPDNYGITVDEVVVMGDWAYARRTDRGKFVPTSGGPAFSQGSRHFSILRRQPDGAWKIARDMFHNPPLDDLERKKNLDTRIASFDLSSGNLTSANVVEYWNCTQNEDVTDAQLWEASRAWINVMNSMHPGIKGQIYLEFPLDGRGGVGQFKFALVFDDVTARTEFWSDLDNEKVEKADMDFDALASCVDGALVSSLEVTDE